MVLTRAETMVVIMAETMRVITPRMVMAAPAVAETLKLPSVSRFPLASAHPTCRRACLALDPSVVQKINGKGQAAGEADSLVTT